MRSHRRPLLCPPWASLALIGMLGSLLWGLSGSVTQAEDQSSVGSAASRP